MCFNPPNLHLSCNTRELPKWALFQVGTKQRWVKHKAAHTPSLHLRCRDHHGRVQQAVLFQMGLFQRGEGSLRIKTSVCYLQGQWELVELLEINQGVAKASLGFIQRTSLISPPFHPIMGFQAWRNVCCPLGFILEPGSLYGWVELTFQKEAY